jgi:glycosyltransferase involved in cell wall biosynthesis
MPRLLLICEFPTIYGAEQSMLATLDGVRAAGYDVRVACPPTGLLAETLRRRNICVTPFSVRDSSGRRIPLDQLRQTLSMVIRCQQPHLVHANSLSMSRLAGPVTEDVRLPSVGHLRDIVGLSRAAISDVNRIDRLLAVSHATRRFHVKAGVDASKTHVLYNGVCLNEFRPRPATGWLHEELKLPRKIRLLTSIGQIGIRKGLDVLLRAAKVVVPKHNDVAFLIVGQRQSTKVEAIDFERQLASAAAADPLAGHVFMLGRRNDVASILNESTLLVHAARQEPFGRVLLEAVASGVAVVATDVGGTRELFGIEHDVSASRSRGGIIVPPDDASALAETLLKILDSSDDAATLGAAGRRWAERSLDARVATARLLDHYEAVLRAI